MASNLFKSVLLVAAGFIAGIVLAQLPTALATEASTATDITKRRFHVYIDEIEQNFVFGDEFTGRYAKELVLSDGSKRVIELTPMLHKGGMQVVELNDSGTRTYMGLGGTTTNGTLMVHVIDVEANRASLKTQGWKDL